MSNVVYKKTTDEEIIKYQKKFKESLIKCGIPTIYLGDIKEEERYNYFSNKIIDFNKDNYFNMELGRDIVECISEKYVSNDINKLWTEGNGVLFLFYNNMVIVMDYNQLKYDDDSLLCISY